MFMTYSRNLHNDLYYEAEVLEVLVKDKYTYMTECHRVQKKVDVQEIE